MFALHKSSRVQFKCCIMPFWSELQTPYQRVYTALYMLSYVVKVSAQLHALFEPNRLKLKEGRISSLWPLSLCQDVPNTLT